MKPDIQMEPQEEMPYFQENGRMMLPMSLFINHALCDGWHVTQFYKNLDRELAELSAYLKTQNEQQ